MKHKAPLKCKISVRLVGASPSCILSTCSLGLGGGLKDCEDCEENFGQIFYENFQRGLTDGIAETREKLEREIPGTEPTPAPESSPIADSGDRTQFASGAVRDMHEGKGRMDLLPMCVLLRLARHYENGCRKYGDRNWEKGIPCHSFADSSLRHLVKYMDGQRDEDHLIAAIWNLCGLAWNEEKRPDLMDIPARIQSDD
jgi:hypothetical protein